MATTILTTKLHIPPLRASLVSRKRLVECLDQGLHRKLTVASAPAGFGKTTLLCEWVESLKTRQPPIVVVNWISLDEGDNDPARFGAYLSAALTAGDGRAEQAGEGNYEPGGAEPGGAEPGGAEPGGAEPGGAFLDESHLVHLINKVAGRPARQVLVLDDYHVITSQQIHDAITFVLDHAPENLHLVLATRADPPLPLSRLRARAQVTELRQSDLRFTAEEAADFCTRVMGLDLSQDDVAALEARTEGWIAGLQMAALMLQTPPPRGTAALAAADLIRDFTGSHRFVLDYLTEEVLQRQPEKVQAFLLCTSILERMCAPLCDALLEGWKDGRWPYAFQSSNLLDHLDRANLFVIPLDHERYWYRYHRLFADLLRRRLWQTAPELVPDLHRRASEWHEKQGLTAEAIEHALAADDYERAADLVEGAIEKIFMRSEVATFRNWVEQLPARVVDAHPTLSFYHAWALLMSGRSTDDVEARLQELAAVRDPSGLPGAMTGRLAALRAYLMLFRLDLPQAVELCHEALEHLPESDLFLRSVVAWILSLARLSDGRIQEAHDALDQLVKKGQQVGNRMITVTALCQQARLQMRQGRLQRAYKTYERALHTATDRAGRRLPIASEALFGLGELEREWNHLDAAAETLTEGIGLANQWSELAAFDAYAPLGRVRLAQGDVAAAREAIEMARQIAERSEATRVDDIVVALHEAYFCITQGDAAGAMRWAHKRGLVSDPGGDPQCRPDRDHDLAAARLEKYEQLVLARLFLLQGRVTQALDLLHSLLTLAKELDRTDLLIEIQILSALGYRAQDRHDRVVKALGEALTLAEPGNHVRTFLDEGENIRFLISDFRLAIGEGVDGMEAQERKRLIDYVDRLLAAFPDQPAPDSISAQYPIPSTQYLADPLSEREIEVLRLLSTGMSNPEIAENLVVAVSTVRTHCKNIYGKLDVHSRWDAVQRAHELGLL